MMRAPVGSSLKVMGNTIAIVGSGPMPGRTPTSVPSMQPARHKARFSQDRATLKPSARLPSKSIPPSARPAGPDRQGNPDPPYEERHGAENEGKGQNRDMYGSRGHPGEGADDDGDCDGQHDAAPLQERRKEKRRDRDHGERADRPAVGWISCPAPKSDGDNRYPQEEEDGAQQPREIAG